MISLVRVRREISDGVDTSHNTPVTVSFESVGLLDAVLVFSKRVCSRSPTGALFRGSHIHILPLNPLNRRIIVISYDLESHSFLYFRRGLGKDDNVLRSPFHGFGFVSPFYHPTLDSM